MKKIACLLVLLNLLGCIQQKKYVVTKKNNPATENKISTCRLSELNLEISLGSPRTIDQATELINKLPKPVTISCFLESLNRPLKIFASNSTLSAQPAYSQSDPRIFIFSDELIISIVTKGYGSFFIEFSQMVSPTKSIKAELEFPQESEISKELAYQNIARGFGTSCGGCHGGDSLDQSITHTQAYNSMALKPQNFTEVELSTLRNENYLCKLDDIVKRRCEIYFSLFEFGEVIRQDFPTELPTFF